MSTIDLAQLRPGVTVSLPSGNRITLVSQKESEWTCQYVRGTRKGEVVFSAQFLERLIQTNT